MIIDTNKVTDWAMKHLVISVPIATGAFSWFMALRWQAAIDTNHIAMIIFYFSITAVSGTTTAVLAVRHLANLGLFD